MDNLVIMDLGAVGQGVFTKSDIPEGTEVLEFKGDLLPVSEIEDLTHCLQVGPELFLTSTGGIDDLINHCCEPACGVRLTSDQRVILFALKDLIAGDEITFDYATTQSGNHETLHCLCEAANCRKTIGGFNELPPTLQTFYRRRNAVLPFLLENPN